MTVIEQNIKTSAYWYAMGWFQAKGFIGDLARASESFAQNMVAAKVPDHMYQKLIKPFSVVTHCVRMP